VPIGSRARCGLCARGLTRPAPNNHRDECK
jgi:hypothetical protein